jgi:predicted nucleic acid-binding protein
MLIISDNSAVSALAETGLLPILPALFGGIVLTESVCRECSHARSPVALKEWITHPPKWLTLLPDPVSLLPETANLGAGEASSISLAWEHRGNSLLILDEKRGRRVAGALGLPTTGVVAILGEASRRGLIDFDQALSSLAAVHFHVSDAVVVLVRKRYGL